MTMSETLSLFRQLPARMSAGVVACAEELARLDAVIPEQFAPVFTKIAVPVDAPLPAISLAQVDMLVVEIDLAVPGSLRRIHRARLDYPDLPIIAAVSDLDLNKVRTLMRVGIKDVVSLPFNAGELLPAVIDVSSELAKMPGDLAPMQAIIHSSGGVGASTVVSHLAAAIVAAEPAARCCVVDLDFQFGELASLFGVSPPTSIFDCIDAGDRLDLDLIANAVVKARDGIDLLAAPRDVPPPEKLDVDQLLKLLAMLRRHYDHVLIDFPAGWTGAGLSAACACSEVLLVVDQSVRSISRASKTIALLESVEVGADRVALIVNRGEKRLFQVIGAEEVGQTLGREIAGVIPLAKSGLREAQDRGILLSEQDPRGAFAKSIDQLAQRLLAPGGERA